MSWESEFDLQWETFLKVVQTRVTRESGDQGDWDPARVRAIVEAERGKWSSGGHYQKAWLRNLSKRHPELGREFLDTMDSVRADGPGAIAVPRPWLYPLLALVILALTVDSVLWLQWLGYSALRQGIAATLFGVLAGSALAGDWSRRKKDAAGRAVAQVRDELDAAGDALREIAREADRAEAAAPDGRLGSQLAGRG